MDKSSSMIVILSSSSASSTLLTLVDMYIPSKSSTANTVKMNPGANGENFTSQVAKAGENPDDMQMPMLKPKAALVSRIFAGKISTSQVQKGPQ